MIASICLDAQRSGVQQVRQGCGRPDLHPTRLPGRLAARCGMAPGDPAGPAGHLRARFDGAAQRRVASRAGRPGRLAGLGCVMYQTFARRRLVRREPPRRRRIVLPHPIVVLLFDRSTSSLQPPLTGTASTTSATDPRTVVPPPQTPWTPSPSNRRLLCTGTASTASATAFSVPRHLQLVSRPRSPSEFQSSSACNASSIGSRPPRCTASHQRRFLTQKNGSLRRETPRPERFVVGLAPAVVD